jgi:Alpha/beta hydrolase
VLFFNPAGQGVAAMVIGNLATATRVAILVPGSDTTLATFFSRGAASPGGGAEALAAEARQLDPGNQLAIIAWLGYPAPAMLSPAVMTSGDAGQGAQALRPLVDALAKHCDQVALLCHSYGSVVCGLAAPHLPVSDIAVFGSPGMDASSVASLHTTARVWAGRESGDAIRFVPHIQLLGLGFGADPMSPGFGARIFATGGGGHSGYLDPGSVSLRNLTYIALGDPAAVTR